MSGFGDQFRATQAFGVSSATRTGDCSGAERAYSGPCSSEEAVEKESPSIVLASSPLAGGPSNSPPGGHTTLGASGPKAIAANR